LPPLHRLSLSLRSQWYNQVPSTVTNRDRKLFGSPKTKTLSMFLRPLAQLTILILVQAFWDQLRGDVPCIHIFMNYVPNLLTWDVQLLSYWFSHNQVSGLSKLASEFDQ
jgi:hypothetical protein